MSAKRDLITRIIEKVEGPLDENLCWVFTGRCSNNGYAEVSQFQKKFRAHRIVWEAYNAMPIPPGLLVRHTCDNPSCVNPHHLELGTHQDNTNDKHARGRAHYPGRGNKIKANY